MVIELSNVNNKPLSSSSLLSQNKKATLTRGFLISFAVRTGLTSALWAHRSDPLLHG